jgi:hypothetical protein
MTTPQIRPRAVSGNRIGPYRCAVVLVIAVSAISLGCNAGKSKVASTTSGGLPSDQIKAANDEKMSANETAPTLAEVQTALSRIYQDTLTIDVGESEPVLWGDFNGDGSPDLAAVVRPRGKEALPKLNGEYANWIVEDPRTIVLPDPSKAVQRLPPPSPAPPIKVNDVLLAVLHGYGPSGWHHPYARQTFLLCNAVGENIRSQPLREVWPAAGKKTQSQPQGNVISEKLSGHEGFLYWSNGKYVWHQ